MTEKLRKRIRTTPIFKQDERKMRALLRLSYIQQRWGNIDLDTVPDDPEAKHLREMVMLDLNEVGLLPERFCEETCQIYNDYREAGWCEVL